MEWIFYTNAIYKRKSRQQGRWMDLLSIWVQDRVQRWDEHRLTSVFHGILRNLEEPPPEVALGAGQAPTWIPPMREKRSFPSANRSIIVQKGLSGLIAVMPFTCMPGTIVTAISKRLREDCRHIPFLSLAYDGLDEVHSQTRLEAFMYQVREDDRRGRHGGNEAVSGNRCRIRQHQYRPDDRRAARWWIMCISGPAGSPSALCRKGCRRSDSLCRQRPAIAGVATTGSGRQLAGALGGADIIKNEITSHAIAGLQFLPEARRSWRSEGRTARSSSSGRAQWSISP